MIWTPKILSQVGLFLDAESLYFCTLVCRKWKEIFLPLLWHTFDEATWNAMTKRIPFYRRPVGPQEEMAKRVLQHKGQIRNLNLSSYRILYAVRMAGLTGLTSVTFDKPNHMSTKEYYNLYEVNALTISEALAKDAEDNRFDSEVPEDLFERVAEGKNMMNLTRAYWRFVLMNPGLVQLRFKIRDPRYILPLAVVSPPSGRKNSKPVTVLKPTSLAFLTNLLPSLKTMTHLEVGQNADEFLFSHIMTSLPNLKTFIHSEYSQFDSDLLLKHRHPNLQNLVFRIADLAAVQLRAIVVAFPALQTLTIPGCRITAEEIYEADIWQEIVHPLLTTVVIDDMTGPVQCRLRFPNVRTVYSAAFPFTNLGLQRFLRTFPMAGYLEARRSRPMLKEIREQDNEFELLNEHRIPRPCMITTLVAFNAWAPSTRVDRVFRQMDFLVRLDVDWIAPMALKEIGRVCSKLEYARFDLRERCSRELIDLLIGCPLLKECRGRGHEILAGDIASSDEWTCLGIKVLEIDIVGVLRLSFEQESILNVWRDNECLGMTNDEQDLLDLQLFSYEIQRQVYARLGGLKELEILFIGEHSSPRERRYTQHDEIVPVGLELTLASGLAELGGMEKLQRITFGQLLGGKGLDSDVLAWMWERWSMVEGWEDGLYTVSRQ